MNKKMTILAYHSIGASCDKGDAGADLYTVPQDKFLEQLDCIASTSRPNGRQTILTFDDGDILRRNASQVNLPCQQRRQLS